MQRGRFLQLTVLAGVLALTAGARTPANAAAINTPAAPILTPTDGRVLVTFGGVLNATGYNVYRHAAGAAAALVNPSPTPYTWLIDDNGGAGLANNVSLWYSVKAVLNGAEGPASAENVTTPAPPLFGALVAYNITTPGVDPAPGTVTLDTTKDLITIHTSGDDVWDGQDGQTFVATPITGDFTIQAKIPGPPKGGDPTYGKVGLEMRTGLQPLDAYAYAIVFEHRDSHPIQFEWRNTAKGAADQGSFAGGGGIGDSADDQKYPVWLKLSRQDTVISAQVSEDGTTFNAIADAQDFVSLPPTVYVGLAATAHQDKAYLDGQIVASSVSITTP
jgi:hypothetical protein